VRAGVGAPMLSARGCRGIRTMAVGHEACVRLQVERKVLRSC
jgi:hypothetical protein